MKQAKQEYLLDHCINERIQSKSEKNFIQNYTLDFKSYIDYMQNEVKNLISLLQCMLTIENIHLSKEKLNYKDKLEYELKKYEKLYALYEKDINEDDNGFSRLVILDPKEGKFDSENLLSIKKEIMYLIEEIMQHTKSQYVAYSKQKRKASDNFNIYENTKYREKSNKTVKLKIEIPNLILILKKFDDDNKLVITKEPSLKYNDYYRVSKEVLKQNILIFINILSLILKIKGTYLSNKNDYIKRNDYIDFSKYIITTFQNFETYNTLFFLKNQDSYHYAYFIPNQLLLFLRKESDFDRCEIFLKVIITECCDYYRKNII